MKKTLSILLAITLLLSLFSSVALAEGYKIGVVVPRLSNPFFGRAVEILQEYAATLEGIELIVQDANDDSSTQLGQIENIIAMGVDGVVFAPVTSDALIPAADSLEEVGIPFVTVDRTVDATSMLAHVGGNNVVGGEAAAAEMVKLFGEEEVTVAMLLGTLGASPTLQRQEGFHNVIDAYPNIKVVEESANYERSTGMTVMENIMQAYPDLKAVFTQNEEMGLGAIEALEAMGKQPGDVKVIAFDTCTETLNALNTGWLHGNIEQWPDQQFRTGLDILLAFLKDGTKPAEQNVFLSPSLITKDNISDSEKYNDFVAEYGVK